MAGGGGPKNVTQTTKQEVSPQLAPYLAPFMQQASSVAMRPYESYGGDRIAGFTPDQQAGFQMARDQAQLGQKGIAGAMGGLNDTISGQYLNRDPGTNALLGMDNPYLQSAIDSAQGDVKRQFENSVFNNTDATMARAGAFGGSAWQQAQSENARQMSNELGRVSNDMRMADYGLQAQLGESDLNRRQGAFDSERGRQLAAAGMMPGLNAAGYQNSQALLGIGGAQQAMNQGGLDVKYNDWLNKQNYPNQQLDVMGNAIRTLMGGGGTQTSTAPNPNQTNSIAGALGGALGGASLGGSLFPAAAGATPWGAGIGAGLGLLGGML
ncbi:hypothetical protein [Allopusillimonas ginsengisoli]|uniref:hypothetical protein n=1 Tax=Allopusillimonas ginsengisoli TaxID=453575 RepID=UPI001020522B|nr:hypothetical protein [Allopusillimonas ginsengisoli]TEA78638.1 hypothetical protein ERE07_09585 [Allopusillimonas ginsengisoli]